jgi:hypothetical protein
LTHHQQNKRHLKFETNLVHQKKSENERMSITWKGNKKQKINKNKNKNKNQKH